MGIDASQSYTQIRAQARQEFKRLGGNKTLRFTKGKGLYLKDGSLLKGTKSNRFAWSRHDKKHNDAAEKVRKALNREFDHMKYNGKTLLVGDTIFKAMGNPSELKAEHFELIDLHLEWVMKNMAKAPDANSNQDMRLQAARIFGQANQDPLQNEHMANWEKVVTGTQMLRDAVAADIKARDALDDAGMAKMVMEKLGKAIDQGLNFHTLQVIRDEMNEWGYATDNLDKLEHILRLDQKFQISSPQIQSLNRELANAENISQANKAQVDELTGHSNALLKELDLHFQHSGNAGQKARNKLFYGLRQYFQSAMALADQLENSPFVDDRQLAPKVREQANATYELAMSLPPAVNRQQLENRPQMHVGDALNQPSQLHTIDPPSLKLATSRPTGIYTKDTQSNKKRYQKFEQVRAQYHNALNDLDVALKRFQTTGSGQDLAKLTSALQVANEANDRFMAKINQVLTRHKVKDTGFKLFTPNSVLRLNQDRQYARTQTADLKNTVLEQRKTLQQLTQMAGQVNDQRYALDETLDNIHPKDQEVRRQLLTLKVAQQMKQAGNAGQNPPIIVDRSPPNKNAGPHIVDDDYDDGDALSEIEFEFWEADEDKKPVKLADDNKPPQRKESISNQSVPPAYSDNIGYIKPPSDVESLKSVAQMNDDNDIVYDDAIKQNVNTMKGSLQNLNRMRQAWHLFKQAVPPQNALRGMGRTEQFDKVRSGFEKLNLKNPLSMVALRDAARDYQQLRVPNGQFVFDQPNSTLELADSLDAMGNKKDDIRQKKVMTADFLARTADNYINAKANLINQLKTVLDTPVGQMDANDVQVLQTARHLLMIQDPQLQALKNPIEKALQAKQHFDAQQKMQMAQPKDQDDDDKFVKNVPKQAIAGAVNEGDQPTLDKKHQAYVEKDEFVVDGDAPTKQKVSDIDMQNDEFVIKGDDEDDNPITPGNDEDDNDSLLDEGEFTFDAPDNFGDNDNENI